MAAVPTAQRRSISLVAFSSRILLLAFGGIFFLTMYPFRFAPRATTSAHSSPFLLGGVAKGSRALDAYLNVLLFMPLGFGVSEMLRERGWTRKSAFLAAGIGGFLASYTVEFFQQYTPTRQSRWEDVLTNTAGAIAGFALFELCGNALVRWASSAECALRTSLTLRHAAAVLAVYFVLWFGLSVALQKEAQSMRWNSESRPVVGLSFDGAAEIGPGAALAARIRRIKTFELKGYNEIYDALIFFPAGALFGIAAAHFGARDIPAKLFLTAEFILPPWLLERILSHMSSRAASPRSILLCLIVLIAGALWINADRPSVAAHA